MQPRERVIVEGLMWARPGAMVNPTLAYNGQWRGRWYATKQIEAFAVQEPGTPESWLVITVIVKFF